MHNLDDYLDRVAASFKIPQRTVAPGHRHCFQWNGDYWMGCECGQFPSKEDIDRLEAGTPDHRAGTRAERLTPLEIAQQDGFPDDVIL